MSKFQKEIEQLKVLLQESDDFSEIFDYFFERLADREDFLRMCKRAKNPMLKQILKEAGKSALQDEVKMTKFLLLKFPKYPFFHGAFFLNGQMGSLIFFKDINMGLMSISMLPQSIETKFARFRSVAVDVSGDRNVTLAPGGKTLH